MTLLVTLSRIGRTDVGRQKESRRTDIVPELPIWWFPTADLSGDPPVCFYTEVDGAPPRLAPERLADTFSAWLIAEACQDIADRAKPRAFHEI